MKATEKRTFGFTKGKIYLIESTAIVPSELQPIHFRKPTYKEEGLDTEYARSQPDKVNDVSDFDYCVKSIKITYTIYT